MTKILIIKFLLPGLLVILFLKFYKRSRMLEKIKRAGRFDYLFPRIIAAIILIPLLLWSLGYLFEYMNPQEDRYISTTQGGRSGSLPAPTHGRKSKMR